MIFSKTINANTGYWILDTGYWILDTGYWILDTGYWILEFVGNGNVNSGMRCLIREAIL